MTINTDSRRISHRVGWIGGACLSALALGAGGFILGSQSTLAAQSAYNAGYSQASTNFCNLQFTSGPDARPFSDDLRRYEFVPENVLVADASCTDDQVKWWNSAQVSAGSPERACKLDMSTVSVTLMPTAAECFATEAFN
jgi:hypothetical protein